MHRSAFVALVVTLVAACAFAGTPTETDTDARRTERIGVYDSRSIAIAYVGTRPFRARMGEVRAEYDRAKASGGEGRMAEIDRQMRQLQVEMHKQAFSTAPVDNILEEFPEDLAQVREKMSVDALVSKWDAATLAKHPTAERVDVTEAMVDAMETTQKQRRAALDMVKRAPLSMDKAENLHD